MSDLPDTPPAYEPTRQMPTVPPTVPGATMPPTAVGGVVPPIDPPDAPVYPDDVEPPTPWYKQPGPVAIVILVVLLLAALIAWLLFGGGDDDDSASAESSRLIIELADETGQPIDRGFLVTVAGPPGAETAFTWLRPAEVTTSETAGDSTGTDGRVDFEWEPDDTVTDLTTWSATAMIAEQLPAGFGPPPPVVECVLVRDDADETVVAMNVAVDSSDLTAERTVTYSFPNYRFTPGDSVTCALVNTAPAVVETTVVDTTIVDTTVADTTTTTTTTLPPTTVPPTTVAPTTAPPPPTTIPVVTVPPQPAATLWDVIDNSPDLSGVKAWIEQAGLQALFEDPDATITFLAPSNQAIEDAPAFSPGIDFSDPANIVLILGTHLNESTVLSASDITALDEFEVVEPGPHAVDDSVDPPTIGGAELLVTDVSAANGVLHVIDTVLLPDADLS